MDLKNMEITIISPMEKFQKDAIEHKDGKTLIRWILPEDHYTFDFKDVVERMSLDKVVRHASTAHFLFIRVNNRQKHCSLHQV